MKMTDHGYETDEEAAADTAAFEAFMDERQPYGNPHFRVLRMDEETTAFFIDFLH